MTIAPREALVTTLRHAHVGAAGERNPADLANRPFRAVALALWVTMVKVFGAVSPPVEVAELPAALPTASSSIRRTRCP